MVRVEGGMQHVQNTSPLPEVVLRKIQIHQNRHRPEANRLQNKH